MKITDLLWIEAYRVEIRYDDERNCALYWIDDGQPRELTAPTLAEAVAQARAGAEESSVAGIGGGE